MNGLNKSTDAAPESVFERHEVKYRVPAGLYPELIRRTEELLVPDFYPHSEILSIYYDTEHNDLISRSLQGLSYKEKLRLRSYGVPERNTTVFPELKKKYAGVVYKRRCAMPLYKAEAFLNRGIRLTGNVRGDGRLQKAMENRWMRAQEFGIEDPALNVPAQPAEEQIVGEIAYFRQFYEVMPKLFIGYDRDSYAGRNQADLRVTFDRNIRYREDRLSLADGRDGEDLDIGGDYLMEIKAQDAIPFDLVRILSEMQIYPDSFSKYGTIYRTLHGNDSSCEPSSKGQQDRKIDRGATVQMSVG